jgi:hypothetical protein
LQGKMIHLFPLGTRPSVTFLDILGLTFSLSLSLSLSDFCPPKDNGEEVLVCSS